MNCSDTNETYMNHTRELHFNALIHHRTIRGSEGQMYFSYSGISHIHLNSRSEALMLSGYYPLCSLLPLHVTAVISSNAFFLYFLP